ncbi:MAG: putative hydro-lyase [Oscillospiraceae bacterium]|nr:putative hydro-lyase [Oscillospiraceae bacterium]
MDYSKMSPAQVRQLIREGKITGQTSGMCDGYAQGNLLILPYQYAYDFLLFTQRNPKSCPILEVGDVGSRLVKSMASGSGDIATDLPKYRVWKNGVLTEEVTDISHLWQDDFVYFLIGCSFSFEGELLAAGVPVRHIEEGKNVPMYLTNIECEPAGIFHGKTVVSMRPMPVDQAIRAASITASMPRVHGAPIHMGDPAKIGIQDIDNPDFGDRVTIHDGEIPVFWCCGVTPQSAVMSAKPPIAISHAPGHMFITDVKNTLLKD